ncbi:MAG: A/G-specific adenine glycosylase, partial [Bacteroidota bacterium]
HWYSIKKRDLPWRNTKDPYKIWLSEIILQQTRVAQGLPYYERFVQQYPQIQDLASAPQDDVMRTWQGLGYYSRARNLHKAAKVVAKEMGGKFPSSYDGLLALPGVGPYTAAAIASIAFGVPSPVLDGNVYRVIARVFAMAHDISASSSRKHFLDILDELISPDHPDAFNQGMMELGATVCSPKNPSCELCPVEDHCLARAAGDQLKYPVKTKKVKVRTRPFHYLVIAHEGHVAMKQRVGNDIWQGLYEFMLVESSSFQLDDYLHPNTTHTLEVSEVYRHILTHQRIEARFYRADVTDKNVFDDLLNKYELKAYSFHQILTLPKPKLMVNYLEHQIF